MAGKATDDEPAVTEIKPTPKTSPAKPTEKPRPPSSANLPAVPVKLPEIPRHYKHIRIAMLAYYGNPMGEFEDKLLRESVDLVVPNPAYLKHVHAVAPDTPQLIYTNASNLYQGLLTDWLAYADRRGVSREAAFYHASRRVGFRGDSPSSQPVTWFWAVYRGGPRFPNLTTSARGRSGRVPFSGRGGALYLGYPERFREVNITLVSGATRSWSAVLEYPTQVDADGKPAQWQPLKMLGDATSGLTQSGRVTFDPPPDWKSVAIGGSARLYYLRFRTAADGTAPVANTIIGRDYVEANGKTTGAIPVFDTKADANHDGYLDDGEYARRTPGKDARFVYESRMFTESYGQMRFGTNPSAAAFRAWAVDYHERMLKKEPVAGGFFMDNSEGKPPVKPAEVLEPLDSFAEDYGAMLHAISEAVAPKWLLANTAGGQLRADPVVRQNPAHFEEYAIRPLAHHYGYFEDLAALVARCSALTKPAPYAVIDSHPQNGSVTDPRMQLATLAYYYLIADPDSTFLMFYGGFEPATTWKRHWLPAVAYDIGPPTAKWSLFAEGPDPAKPAFSYHLYQRPYERALVLYKPLSHARGSRERASIGHETATKHELSGTYQPLQPDGTLGEAITTITLRNGEGAILVRSK